MILSGSQIAQEVDSGSIFIMPFDKGLINPNSYNYRLGEYICEISDNVIDPKIISTAQLHKIPEQGCVLQPGKLYLSSTLEIIGSDTYVVSLIGRSSLGRLGLFLQITADLGQIGTKHQWTLELKVVQPLIVYPRMRIGQVSFWVPDGLSLLEKKLYRNQEESYAQYSNPQPSLPPKFV
jgi:dCTP deaminase